MRDDVMLIQLLKTLYDRPNEDDDNNQENTLIQFFEAPHDSSVLTALALAQSASAALTASPNETVSITSKSTPKVTDPSTLVWGGVDDSGKTVEANWFWGYGGSWLDGKVVKIVFLSPTQPTSY